MPTCGPLSSIVDKIPYNIWAASGQAQSTNLSMGQIVTFKCPEGLKLSNDTDQFDPNDDQQAVLCNSRLMYDSPEFWPICVKPCFRKLPAPPLGTGLVGVVPPNTIPAGQRGRYICSDASLGVGQGSDNFFDVLCNDQGNYEVPRTYEMWPVCQTKTTTVSPGDQALLMHNLLSYSLCCSFILVDGRNERLKSFIICKG